MRPSDYPPPFDPAEVIAAPATPIRSRSACSIVGAGPAGLACAIRLGQLLESAPAVRERLGDVPVAVIDKGSKPGAHLLSGAVVNPVSLKKLFGDRKRIADMPFYGHVSHESVYYLTRKKALRIPAPPTMRNHGNYVASSRSSAAGSPSRPRRRARRSSPRPPARSCSSPTAASAACARATVAAARTASPSPKFEPGSDLIGQVTVLAEGTQGHLTGAAISRFGLEGENPQVWALGVKEVWKVAKPLDHVIHTMGWPLRGGAKYREFGGSFIYPMGDEMLTIGMVVGLDYRDAELSVHDLLQELKTHPKITRLLRGGERVAWGAKTIPEGGWYALPKQMHAPGLVLAGDAAGTVNVPALKGIHYAVESGCLAAEAIFAALQPGEVVWRPGALAPYDQAVRSGLIGKDLYRVRNMRQVFEKGFVRGAAMAGAATASLGHVPHGRVGGERDADQELISTDRSKSYPAPDGKLTFDKLSSVYLSGNKTRDDAPNHIRIETRVPREVAELWVRMCPAQVYEIGPADAGKVQVVVTPSNCVQCGAITAKGGRLTPPEGGAGPEYTLT